MLRSSLIHLKTVFCTLLIIGYSNNSISQYISTADALERPLNRIVKVSGTTFEDNTGGFEYTYDARGWSIETTEIYPIKIGNNKKGTRQVWVGGKVLMQSPREVPWDDMKRYYDGTAILINSNDYMVVDGIRIDNAMDAIRIRGNASRFRISNVYATNTRDDAIENDNMMGGQIDDCLFDGCFVFLSQQGKQKWTTSDSLIVKNTLVRLQKMPYDTDVKGNSPEYEKLYGVNALRHGQLFKHHGSGDAPLQVHDCIFYVPQYSVNGIKSMYFPDFEGCKYSNVILLWAGGGNYPGKLPASGVTEYNLNNRTQEEIDQIWEDEVFRWMSRHDYKIDSERKNVE